MNAGVGIIMASSVHGPMVTQSKRRRRPPVPFGLVGYNSKYGNRVVDVVHGGAQFDQLDVRWRSKIEVSSIIIVGT